MWPNAGGVALESEDFQEAALFRLGATRYGALPFCARQVLIAWRAATSSESRPSLPVEQFVIACAVCGTYSNFSGPPPTAVQGDAVATDIGGGLVPPTEQERAPRAISEANAWIITDLLRDVVRRGTGQRARALGRGDIAGKTGTTNDGRDAWFSGFNPDLVATSVGSTKRRWPDGSSRPHCRCGSISFARRSRPAVARLPMPDGVVTARVNYDPSQFGGEDAAPASDFEFFLADHPPAGVQGATEDGVQNSPSQRYEEPIF